MPAPAKLKVGLLVNDGPLPLFAWKLLESSKLHGHYEVSHFFVNSAPPGRSPSRLARIKASIQQDGMRRFISTRTFNLLSRLEDRLVRNKPHCAAAFETRAMDAFSCARIPLAPQISKSGLIYRYPEADLASIRKSGVDVLIRIGGGILKGDILHTCLHGVLSFHHADNDINRGSPPGFWEVYARAKSTGFIIQRLTEELDGGDVLYKGAVPTQAIHAANRSQLFLKSAIFMDHILQRLAQQGALLEALPSVPYAHPLFTAPTLRQQARYCANVVARKFQARLNKMRGRGQNWQVGFMWQKDLRKAVLRKVIKVPNPPGSYLADPMVFRHDGRNWIFVEELVHADNKGRISLLEIGKDGTCTNHGIVLDVDCHLSYPFVFQTEQGIFMLPETSASGQIRLYRAEDFPRRWTLHKVLMDGMPAVDTQLFQHDGRWWMFTNICSAGIGEFGSELHIFHADTCDATQWTPHKANPVVFDSTRARNGGWIRPKSGALPLRCYQKQGFDIYGEALGVARITRLTPDEYCEETEFEIAPAYFPGLTGTHTLSEDDGLMALDFI